LAGGVRQTGNFRGYLRCSGEMAVTKYYIMVNLRYWSQNAGENVMQRAVNSIESPVAKAL
jgi:hypothetical protein